MSRQPLDRTESARRQKVFSNDVVAWVAQLSLLGACAVLAVSGIAQGGDQISAWFEAIELGGAALIVMLVIVSLLLRMQVRAATRLHPGTQVVTALANVQFVAQLRAAAKGLNVPAVRGYSGTYYAVAFDAEAIWVVLGSVRPKDIIRIPRSRCTDITVERTSQGVFMQNSLELHFDSNDGPLVIDFKLLRPLALAPVSVGRARLNATVETLRETLSMT